MNQLERTLLRLNTDLCQLKAEWALVGGFAVSIRSRPRTTFDIDVAVSVANDRDGERLIHSLRQLGYVTERILEQETTDRLAGARLAPPADVRANAPVDLLFASSGIENEVAAQAELMEVLKGVFLPVARLGHLVALKVLADQAGRPQDRSDALALLAVASADERELARASLDLIERRGFHRGKDLKRALRQLVSELDAGDG